MMFYPMVSNAHAFHELMFGYGTIAAFMTLWAIITVENTDNMSLVEIEKSLRKDKDSFGRVFKKQTAEKETRANKDSIVESPELPESAPLLK